MKKFLIGIAVAVLVILGFSATFVTYQKEFVAVRQFGEIIKIVEEPGLYFKVPFIQDVQHISKAVHIYDIPASDVITKDKKSMIADNYVLWKVVDAPKYVKMLGAVDARAEERVEAAVYNATKNVISSLTQDDMISHRGEELYGSITTESNSDIGQYGIQIVSTQIKALDLPNDNKEAVYQRMVSERNNIAAGYTAQGKAEAQKIRNETDKQVTVMMADAKKKAAILEAEGEAEYMKILAKAYNDEEKAEFYDFIRGLDALKTTLSSGSKTIMLDKDSELVRILYGVE